jgi:hypothetical protein
LASHAKVVHHSARRDGGPRRSLRELRLASHAKVVGSPATCRADARSA